MLSLRSAMDRMFDDAFFSRANWELQPFSGDLALDVSENDDEFVVKASLPGINPDELEVSFSGRTLTLKGEIKSEEEKEGEHYHLRERRYGSFARSLTLPTPVNADAIEARYEAGVLTLRLPKVEEVKPKRIAIQGTKSPQLVEGKAKDIAHNKN
jgi:HSP20 family protein